MPESESVMSDLIGIAIKLHMYYAVYSLGYCPEKKFLQKSGNNSLLLPKKSGSP